MDQEIEHVRVPDEIRFVASRICETFPKRAKLDPSGEVSIGELSPEEDLAGAFVQLSCYVDEIIDNINTVISDLGLLADSSRAFGDNHPFRRYKLLVRLFYYEFGRFEDAFGYYTLWLNHHKILDKKQRKSLMEDFHNEQKPLIVARSICLHDDPTWKPDTSPEIRILEGLDMFGLLAKDKDGKTLEWDPHLAPLCNARVSQFYQFASNMRTTWNMLFSNAAEEFIKAGKLKRVNRTFKPKNLVRRRSRGHDPGSL